MVALHPQFIEDTNGNNALVVLPIKEFNALLEQLSEIENIKFYDEVNKENNSERILFSDYLKNRNKLTNKSAVL